eukprot:6206303-Pleurochrysis_carterae.AAC.3
MKYAQPFPACAQVLEAEDDKAIFGLENSGLQTKHMNCLIDFPRSQPLKSMRRTAQGRWDAHRRRRACHALARHILIPFRQRDIRAAKKTKTTSAATCKGILTQPGRMGWTIRDIFQKRLSTSVATCYQ